MREVRAYPIVLLLGIVTACPNLWASDATPGFKSRLTRRCVQIFRAAFWGKPGSYDPIDFPQSALAPLSYISNAHQAYSAWASEMVNQSVQALRSGKTSQEVLDSIAEGRQELAKHMLPEEAQSKPYNNWRQFGADRSVVMNTYISLLRIAEGATKRNVYRLALLRLDSHPASSLGLTRKSTPNHYITLNDGILEGSSVEESLNDLRIKHMTSENIAIVMNDVHRRLNDSRFDSRFTELQRKEGFLIAMYGFYNAMPYCRGSSAIGKVFFAALYESIFNEKIPQFEDGIDVVAMIFEQKEFIDRYLLRFFSIPSGIAQRNKSS